MIFIVGVDLIVFENGDTSSFTIGFFKNCFKAPRSNLCSTRDFNSKLLGCVLRVFVIFEQSRSLAATGRASLSVEFL